MFNQNITAEYVAELMEHLYRHHLSIEVLSGGVNMRVFKASFGEKLEDRVIKFAGDGDWKPWAVLDEQVVMRTLREEGISEVPEIEFTQEAVGWSSPPFLVMRCIQPGLNIETDIGPNHPDAERIWRSAGALRAKLADVDWQCTTRTLTPRQAAEQLLRFVGWDEQALDRLPEFRGVFADLLDAVKTLARAQGQSFGQKDGCEMLTDGDSLALVDFSGFVGAHRRLRELGMINGRLRWRDQTDPRAAQWHEQGFFAGQPITSEMRQELTVWEIYSLVSNAGWLTQTGRLVERDSQLDFARQRLEIERPV
ncbi:MAG: phosphotransferase [Anaerolineae bacterium]|nr:phosphotransferase [Anaerolineae bacterium]